MDVLVDSRMDKYSTFTDNANKWFYVRPLRECTGVICDAKFQSIKPASLDDRKNQVHNLWKYIN